MKRSRGRRDANSDRLDAYARSLGVEVVVCSQFGELGFDRLYLFQGQIYMVEYKNPTRHWELTETEQRRREQCLRAHVSYHVIESPLQIADILNLPFRDQARLLE